MVRSQRNLSPDPNLNLQMVEEEMPDLNEIINSKAFETKVDSLARKAFFKSFANVKLFINPFAILLVVLVGFIFTELNTSVKALNTSLLAFSGELREIRDTSQKAYNQSVLNKHAIVSLVEQQLINVNKEGR